MYDLNLTVPNFNSSKYTQDNKFTLLKNYLYELNEVLSFALSDKQDTVVESLVKRVENNAENEKTQILALKKQSKERFEELKADILRTADEICTAYATDMERTETEILQKAESEFVGKTEYEEYKSNAQTILEQNSESISLNAQRAEEISSELEAFKKSTNAEFTVQSDAILSQVENIYTAKTAAAELEERLSSKITQDSQSITESFSERISTLEDDISSVGGELTSFIGDLDVYIRRGKLSDDAYGIEIGRSDSSIKARFTNDRLSFFQGLTEVAYISGNNLYITRAEILDYLKLGNTAHGYFTFDITERGLEVRWTDGS